MAFQDTAFQVVPEAFQTSGSVLTRLSFLRAGTDVLVPLVQISEAVIPIMDCQDDLLSLAVCDDDLLQPRG